jgi:hypothetical protein
MSLMTLPARAGRAVRVAKGGAIRIVNTHGTQVVDTWAFNASDLTEPMSMEHTRPTLGSIFPQKGRPLYTNRRRPILVLEEDSSPGIHDTLMAACDVYRYGLLGCTTYHDNCTDNLHAGLAALGVRAWGTPQPLNLWMNIPVSADGTTAWGEPVSKPGDHVLLRAAMDCIVAMSACPQDMLPINGAAMRPVEAHYEVIGPP